MRPSFALNCLLQIEQERSEEESFVGDALALAFRCTRFCSASLILFASYSPSPLLMRPHHFVRRLGVTTTAITITIIIKIIIIIIKTIADDYVCMRFYGPVNPLGSCRVQSVYLTTFFLGRQA